LLCRKSIALLVLHTNECYLWNNFFFLSIEIQPTLANNLF
jgi:hypothetical protein